MKNLIAVFILTFSTSVLAIEALPESIEKNQTSFERCNSYTLRYGLFFKIAEIGWYAENCDVNQPILEIGNKIVRFHYFRDVEADFFKESAEDFFVKNLNGNQKRPELIEDLRKFNNSYTGIKPGEYFDLFHQDKDKLSLFRNSQLLGSTNNQDLAVNYFNIWFGKEPVIDKLKKAFN